MGEEPKLARRRENRKSSIKIGRTIAEKREHLETKNERTAARKKDKFKKNLRIVLTIIGFVALVALLLGLYFSFRQTESELEELNNADQAPKPTIEIIDEAATSSSSSLTNRMLEYINQVSTDLRTYGIVPTKAVVPSSAIREVDFYIEGYNGFLKTTVDRGAGVTAEDADRMLRYLKEQGISDFTYIDLRLSGKAYWK